MSEKALLILAMDHRDSLETKLYELTEPPTPAQAARIAADKLLVYQALVDAADRLPDDAQPAVLVDEQYGASVAELAGRTAGAVTLTMPIEASGHEWFEFAYDDWQQHASFFATDHSKVLIRDNPALDAGKRAKQAADVATISGWAAEHGKPLILELLVPATDADLAGVAGDQHRYDDEVRPRLTEQVIADLQDAGVEPAIWKIEGLDSADDARAVVAAAQRDGRTAQCIVLGRHSEKDALLHWLQVGAPVPGFCGFAIGRSIWWDALEDLLHDKTSQADARIRITQEYLDYADAYLKAR
jgi:myo-inositol catabolism protein IolC